MRRDAKLFSQRLLSKVLVCNSLDVRMLFDIFLRNLRFRVVPKNYDVPES